MTLRTRLSLLVALLICVLTGAMGGAAVEVAYRTSVQNVDDALTEVATRASAARDDGLSTALYSASLQAQPVAIALLGSDSSATWLTDAGDIDFPEASGKWPGATGVETMVNGHTYRVLQAEMVDGDRLLLALDVTTIAEDRSTNLRVLLIVSGLLAFLGVAAARLLVRRDLQRIRDLASISDRISEGALDTPVPAAVGVSEVDALASSLGRMVASLNDSFESLQSSHAQLRTFLGDVSHELRTPLTVVRGYVELLGSDEELPDDMRARAVSRSLAEIERMQSLIADLLLLAEFTEQRQPTLVELDLREVVRDGVLDLMSLEPSRPVEARLADTPCPVSGDLRALQSVCSNLLGNIRRHTPASAPVRITLDQAQDSWLLMVEDGGPGLTDEQYAVPLDDLERFNRLRSQTTGGSGLGLRIVATVVRMHGGSIALMPSSLGGLRVECRFPNAMR